MNDSYVDQSRSLNPCSCHIYIGENKGKQYTYPELHAKERAVRVCWHVVNDIYSALIWNDSQQIFVIIYLCQIRAPILFSLRRFSWFTCLTLQALYPDRLPVIIFRLWDCLIVTSRPSRLHRGYIWNTWRNVKCELQTKAEGKNRKKHEY